MLQAIIVSGGVLVGVVAGVYLLRRTFSYEKRVQRAADRVDAAADQAISDMAHHAAGRRGYSSWLPPSNDQWWL